MSVFGRVARGDLIERVVDRVGRRDAARANCFEVGLGPPRAKDVLTGEVDDGIRAVDRGAHAACIEGVVLGDCGAGRHALLGLVGIPRECDDLVPRVQQMRGEVLADEPRRSGDGDPHGRLPCSPARTASA